ncbi:unnamed protein product [Ambrosiozyma monospora]|uniref:Unnamed protein product n=1 Tax=Ambrosiozyma monospora TaxID=43982 RepID=A0ACB5SU76_AMBMO|nr:unnamed protein product [Ambrosiozyma monospora]
METANMDSTPPTPSTSHLTCQYCRLKKVKCDRKLPKCTRCSKINIECEYKERLKRGPKRKKVSVPNQNPTTFNNYDFIEAKELVRNGSTKSLNSSAKTVPPEPNIFNVSIFDLIPIKDVHIMIDWFFENPSTFANLCLTRKYISYLLKMSKFLVISGVLCRVSVSNPEYKKYFPILFKYLQYQRCKLSVDGKDHLELIQANYIEAELLFLRLHLRTADAVLKEAALMVQKYNFHLIDAIICQDSECEKLLVSKLCGAEWESSDLTSSEILHLTRMAYWTIVLTEKYCAMGSGASSDLRVENQKVNLPHSRLKFNEVYSKLFDLSPRTPEFLEEFRKLSIWEIKLALMTKGEDIVVWLKEVDFVFKTSLVEGSREDILAKSSKYISEIDNFMACVLEIFDLNIQASLEFFIEIKSPSFTIKAILLQTVVQLFSTTAEKSASDMEVFTANQKLLFESILSIKDGYFQWSAGEYLTNHTNLFTIHTLLKLLAFNSRAVVFNQSDQLVNFTSRLVYLITEMAYKYDDMFAHRVLDEYNSSVETDLIESLFYMEGLKARDNNTNNKLIHFSGFFNGQGDFVSEI